MPSQNMKLPSVLRPLNHLVRLSLTSYEGVSCCVFSSRGEGETEGIGSGGGTNRQLAHLQDQQVAPQLFEKAQHDELVNASGEEEGDEGGGVLVDLHG